MTLTFSSSPTPSPPLSPRLQEDLEALTELRTEGSLPLSPLLEAVDELRAKDTTFLNQMALPPPPPPPPSSDEQKKEEAEIVNQMAELPAGSLPLPREFFDAIGELVSQIPIDPAFLNQASSIYLKLERDNPDFLCQQFFTVLASSSHANNIRTYQAAFFFYSRVLPHSSIPECLRRAPIHVKNSDSTDKILLLYQYLSNLTPQDIPRHDWLLFLPFILRWFESPYVQTQELGFSMLSKLVQGGFKKRLEYTVDSLCKNLKKTLSSELIALESKTPALLALVGCILRVESPKNYDTFQDLLCEVINTFFYHGQIMLLKSYEKYAYTVILQLTLLAREKPKFLKKQIDKVLEFMLSIVENQEYGKPRFQGVEFVVTLAEEKAKPESLILLNEGVLYIERMLCKMLSMLEDMNEQEDMNEREESVAHAYGVTSLTRFAGALGGKKLLDLCPQTIESRLSSQVWQSRHAAVASLSIIAKSSPKDFKDNLGLVIDPAIKAVEDTNPCVRRAAMTAIMEFSKHLSPEFQHQYYQIVLPLLSKAVNNDYQDSYIQVEAATAMILFSQHCTSDILAPYLDQMAASIMSLSSLPLPPGLPP